MDFIVLRKNKDQNAPSLRYWILSAFLVAVFLTGGASRIDVQSLIVLRPLSVVVCAFGLLTLTKDQCARHKTLLLTFAAIVFIAAAHLVPLPPGIWHELQGRSDLKSVDDLVGFKDVWRPLTITPMNGWHALASLFVPLAVLILGIQLSRDDLYRLLLVIITLSVFSGFLGLLQVIGDPQGPLYFYSVTNQGSAVGLFANRNHSATLLACLFPMLAVFASSFNAKANERTLRPMIAIAIALTLVPLILITGSRSGLLTSIVGLFGATILFHGPRSSRLKDFSVIDRNRKVQILIAFVAIGLGALTLLLSRAEAIDRFLGIDMSGDARTDFWVISVDLFWKYFPLGSGSGSYVEAYKILEPPQFIDATYLNHAHNDWIEIAVTFGVPGIVMMLIAFAMFIKRAFALWFRSDGNRRSVSYGRMASVALIILSLASVGDYPLRTPIMMCMFAVFTLWFVAEQNEQFRATSKAKS